MRVVKSNITLPHKHRLEFIVYCIEIVAARLDCSQGEVYRRMERVGLIRDFIRKDDPLHTQSREYVTDEVIVAISRREERMQPGVKGGQG